MSCVVRFPDGNIKLLIKGMYTHCFLGKFMNNILGIFIPLIILVSISRKKYYFFKGADMMINERLGKSEHHVKHLNATNHHLDDFAVKGLRTLNYAYKDISNKEYDEWKKEHKIAETAIIEREVCLSNTLLS